MYCFVNNIKIKKVENFDKRMDIRPVYLPSHYRTQDVSKYSSLGTALAPFYTCRVSKSRVNNVIPKCNLRNTVKPELQAAASNYFGTILLRLEFDGGL